MSNSKKRFAHPDQPTLFDLIRQEQEAVVPKSEQGSLNVQADLRECLVEAIKGSQFSRWEIAGKMSNLLNIEVTIHQINAWTAESKEGHRFPAEYLPAFCRAVNCYEPLKLIATRAGVFVMPGQDALRAEVQKLEEKIKELQNQKRKRLMFLGEMGDDEE